MGTNYYAHNTKNACDKCGRGAEEHHIGKASFGWKFLFNPFKRSYKEWIKYLKEEACKIVDEYGKIVTLEDFIENVQSKQKGISLKDEEMYMRSWDLYEFFDEEGYRISKDEDFC